MNVPARLRKVIEVATQYDADARPKTVDDFKRLVEGPTPTVPFLPPALDGTLLSSDGSWSIGIAEKAGRYSVEVRRSGRRRNALGAADLTAAKAHAHLKNS